MIVYLVRHGEAKHPAVDPERGLSPKGVEQAASTARAAARRGVSPSSIFHSEKTRATETAGILAEYLKPSRKNETAEHLAPNDDPKEWAARLNDTNEDVMLVGHLPHLPGLASLLLNGDDEKEYIPFQTATMAALEKSDKNNWKLLWIINSNE